MFVKQIVTSCLLSFFPRLIIPSDFDPSSIHQLSASGQPGALLG